MITVAAYDRHVEQLFELMRRLHAALTKAEVDYRIVGGMAVFFQVSERDPDAARLTRDVDVAIDRNDIQRIARVAEDSGLRYQHAAGTVLEKWGSQSWLPPAFSRRFPSVRFAPASKEPPERRLQAGLPAPRACLLWG